MEHRGWGRDIQFTVQGDFKNRALHHPCFLHSIQFRLSSYLQKLNLKIFPVLYTWIQGR